MKFIYKSKTADFNLLQNNYFHLLDLGQQTSATASLTGSVLGGLDGDIISHAQTQPRTLTLNLRVKEGVKVEIAKREILKVIKIKQQGTIEWEQEGKTKQIQGIVEAVEMPRYTDKVFMQIAMHCEQPFWEDLDEIIQEINTYINLHYFTNNNGDMLYFLADGQPIGAYDTARTKTFTNEGDVEVGLTIEIIAFDQVTNPIIYDTFGNFFGVGYGNEDKQVTIQNGEVIRITTHRGNKTVKIGNINLYDKIKENSTWLQLQTGENQFRVDSDDASIDNMTFNLMYKQRYI